MRVSFGGEWTKEEGLRAHLFAEDVLAVKERILDVLVVLRVRCSDVDDVDFL